MIKQENQELLLKDLSSRLTYGVIIHSYYRDYGDVLLTGFDLDKGLVGCIVNGKSACFEISYGFKPYLRPMSSMTEEEALRFEGFKMKAINSVNIPNSIELIDWLNAHHFDYRGLIEKGLAIEVTEENNPYK